MLMCGEYLYPWGACECWLLQVGDIHIAGCAVKVGLCLGGVGM